MQGVLSVSDLLSYISGRPLPSGMGAPGVPGCCRLSTTPVYLYSRCQSEERLFVSNWDVSQAQVGSKEPSYVSDLKRERLQNIGCCHGIMHLPLTCQHRGSAERYFPSRRCSSSDRASALMMLND